MEVHYKLNDLILSRIVCTKRLTRKRYSWWFYIIKNDLITIMPLKDQMPSLNGLLLALIQDKEFIREYLSNKFYLDDFSIDAYAKSDGMFRYYYIKNNNVSTLTEVILKERDNCFMNDINELPILHLILILKNEYPNLFGSTMNSSVPYIKLKIGKDNKTESWTKENQILFEKFKDMNVDNKFKYFIFKYFSGLSKNDNKLKTYPFRLSYDWYKPWNNNGNFYDYLKRVYGGKFRKIFIMFFVNGYDITNLVQNKKTGVIEKLPRKTMIGIKNLFIKNGCKFT